VTITVEQFWAITRDRIPTPQEFVAFAEGRRWKFRVTETETALLANKGDPLAVSLARMLSREPYRTNVLAYLAGRTGTPPAPSPAAPPEPERPPPQECQVCGRDVSNAEDRARLADPLFCPNGGSKAVTDGTGRFHPSTARCPFKPKPWNESTSPG
jgi:hypothetical protein